MTKSRTICLVLAIFAVGCSVASSIAYKLAEDARCEARYREEQELKARGEITFSGLLCYQDRHRGFLMLLTALSGLGLGILVFGSKMAWSLPAFVSALLMFPYWIWDTRWALSMAEGNDFVQGLDRVLYRATTYDLATAAGLSFLVIYQSFLLFTAMRTAVAPSKLP